MESSEPQPARSETHLTVAAGEEQISAAPGSSTSLQVGILNDGPLPEEVMISVTGIPSGWITGNERLMYIPAGQMEKILLTILPPPLPESRVGQYPLEIRAVGRSDPDHPATATCLLTVAAYESRGRIGLLLGSTQFSVVPGSAFHIPMLLVNHGLQADSFRLGMTGLPANWISTDSPITRLAPGESREVMATIHVPRSPQAGAGRTPFVLQVASQLFPDEAAEASCILTIAAFSQFTAALDAGTLGAGQPGQVTVSNQGNTVDAYSLSFQNPGSLLVFQKPVQVARPGSQPGTQRLETGYAEIPVGDRLQVEPGQSAAYPFRTRLRSRPLVGGEASYPYTVTVTSSDGRVQDLPARVVESALMPVWLPVLLGVGAVGFCLLFMLFSFRNLPSSATATQTAAVNQTQTALAAGPDSDGDGLSDTQESTLGTDPHLADTDADGLPDGQEAQQFQTDPRNPDTDADLLNDGEEVKRSTNPRVADTDQDGLGDGAEISIGTNPLVQDSDQDKLLDGQENQNCPRPLTPDSDGDGILDGNDRDPCNPSNPSLTAAAPTQPFPTQPIPTQPLPTQPLPTVPLPTQPLPTQPLPTQVPLTVVIPTVTSISTNTGIPPIGMPPGLQGAVLFSSDRDGNAEIYSLNLANQSFSRLTTNTTQDIQPVLAPDSVQFAFVSNQDGNNEIYLGGTDGRAPVNLTRNAADDQQPSWSPDGNWIAFTSNRDGNREIYIMRKDGSELRNLTSNPADDFAPAWYSVSGFFGPIEWIAFTSTRDGNQEVYRVRPNAAGLTNLTKNPAQDYTPSGFREGSTLAFVSERDGNPEIYTMDQNGAAVTRITTNPAQDMDPSIGANGWITFSSDRDGNLEVYAIPTQGGTAYNLTNNPAQDRDPDW
jgi:hypothetical protein